MTHREIMEALTGLLLAMFVAMLSSTVVSNALPAIVTDLEGRPWRIDSPSVLAAAPGVHDELLDLLAGIGDPRAVAS